MFMQSESKTKITPVRARKRGERCAPSCSPYSLNVFYYVLPITLYYLFNGITRYRNELSDTPLTTRGFPVPANERVTLSDSIEARQSAT